MAGAIQVTRFSIQVLARPGNRHRKAQNTTRCLPQAAKPVSYAVESKKEEGLRRTTRLGETITSKVDFLKHHLETQD